VFEGLFLARTLAAVDSALRAAAVATERPLAVVGNVRLGRAMAERRHHVLIIANDQKALRRLKRGAVVCGDLGALPLADRTLGALIGLGAGGRDDWEPLLAHWSRTVVDGGALVLVDRAPGTEMSRRALCAGLGEIQQRSAGRVVVTSGRVTAM